MTLQQLEYILAVEQTGNFTKAAAQCMVTQPTLSAMIQKLEEELDVKIFDRNKHPIEPTAIGRVVLKQANFLLSESSKMKEYIQEERNSIIGKFRLAVLPTIAPYLLPRFLPSITQKYPELDIYISEMKTKDIKKAINDGDIDAGIVANLSDMDDFNKDLLYYEQFYGYVARGEKIFNNQVLKTCDLKDEQMWLLDEGHCFRDQLVKFCQMRSSQKSQSNYQLGSMETFMRMVEGGVGLTFIPELAIDQLSEQQRELVRPFAVPCPTRKIVLLTSNDFVRQSIKQVIIDEIKLSVPKQMLTKQSIQHIV